MDETKIEQKETPVTLDSLNKSWNDVFKKFTVTGCDYVTAMQTWYTSNPYVQNQRLKQLKASPVFLDREDLEEALGSPQDHEDALQSMSWSLTANTYPYYKLVRMYTDLLSYKYYAYPKFVDKEDMKTPRFKSDSKVVSMALDRFQPAYTFRRIAQETLIEGKRAYVLRINANTTTGSEKVEYFTLQELPTFWWKPVAKTTDSYYVVSFNFAYFWNVGTNLNQFPPVFTQYYNQLMGCSKKAENGSLTVDPSQIGVLDKNGWITEYRDNQWFLWHEIEDAFVFSADESHVWKTPPFLGLFLAGQDLQSYYLLQTQLSSLPLYGILTGEVPFAEKNASGTYVNDLKLSPDVVVGLTAQANAVLPPGVSSFFSPFQNVQFAQFEEQVNSSKIYTEALQQFLGSSGTTSLLSTTPKPTVAQVKSGEKIESRYADIFYGQFKNFMNIVFKKYLKLKYEWLFEIFGNVFTEKDRKQEVLNGLDRGLTFLMPEFLAWCDLDVESATCIGDWIDNSELYDKFKVLLASFSAPKNSGTTSKTGRPAKNLSDIDNDSTGASADTGTNTSEGRSFTVTEEELEELIQQRIEDNESE